MSSIDGPLKFRSGASAGRRQGVHSASKDKTRVLQRLLGLDLKYPCDRFMLRTSAGTLLGFETEIPTANLPTELKVERALRKQISVLVVKQPFLYQISALRPGNISGEIAAFESSGFVRGRSHQFMVRHLRLDLEVSLLVLCMSSSASDL